MIPSNKWVFTDIVSEEKNLSLIEVNEEAKQPLADDKELSKFDDFVYSLAGPIKENAKVVVSLHIIIIIYLYTFAFSI